MSFKNQKQIVTARRPNTARDGTTILEVIVTMLVATVGVFGVVALIPFAIRQAEIGLSREDAINAARNLQARMEASGYTDPNRWSDNRPTPTPLPSSPYRQVRVFCLDPIGATGGSGVFPFSNIDITTHPQTVGLFPKMIYAGNTTEWLEGIPRFTLFDSTGTNTNISQALAKRMFGYDNDLLFETEQEKASPPAQQYFVDSTNANVKRMTEGNTSCLIFAVARGQNAMQSNEYTFYTVVYRKRVPSVQSERVFTVVDNSVNPLPNTLYGGGDIPVAEITTTTPDTPRLGRNDWVMMLNATPPPPADSSGNTFPGMIRSLQFYQVRETYEAGGNSRVTLQGGDFKLTDPLDPAGVAHLPTYMIHMPDVIAVYESTFRWESNSTWN